MKTIGTLFAAALLALALGTGMRAIPASAHPSIDIAASNWKFTPSTVTVHVGELTTLRVTSSEGVHGLQSDELGIAATTMLPGKFETVTFTPKKLGTYKAHCSVVCGAGHADMVLQVKVVE